MGWCTAGNESSDTIELFLKMRSPETSDGVIMTVDDRL